jgi:hypothetical protein
LKEKIEEYREELSRIIDGYLDTGDRLIFHKLLGRKESLVWVLKALEEIKE